MFTTSSAPPAAWREDRAGGAPRVLADRDRDPYAGDDEQRAVDGGRREVALLVEHRVVGEQVLVVHAEHPAVRAHRGRVEEVAPRFGEADDRGRTPGTRRDLLERLTRLRHERRAQQQVFGRVAGDGELGEGDEIAARPPRRGRTHRGCAPRCRRGRRPRDRAARPRRGAGACSQDTRHCRHAQGRGAPRVLPSSSAAIDAVGRRRDRSHGDRTTGGGVARSRRRARLRTTSSATASSRSRARRARSRRRSSPTRRCSTPCATPRRSGASAAETTTAASWNACGRRR